MDVVALRTERGVTPLVGEYQALRAHLAMLAETGRLTAGGLVASGRLADGRCYARVRLLPAAQPTRQRRPRPLVIAAVLAGTTLTGLVVWLLVGLVAWVIAHLAAIIAAAVVLAIVAVLLMSGGGKHCPGCRG